MKHLTSPPDLTSDRALCTGDPCLALAKDPEERFGTLAEMARRVAEVVAPRPEAPTISSH